MVWLNTDRRGYRRGFGIGVIWQERAASFCFNYLLDVYTHKERINDSIIDYLSTVLDMLWVSFLHLRVRKGQGLFLLGMPRLSSWQENYDVANTCGIYVSTGTYKWRRWKERRGMAVSMCFAINTIIVVVMAPCCGLGLSFFADIRLLSVPLLSSPILYAIGLHSLVSHHKLLLLFLVSPPGIPQTKCKASEKVKYHQARLIASWVFLIGLTRSGPRFLVCFM
jgi:hypothetical protein